MSIGFPRSLDNLLGYVSCEVEIRGIEGEVLSGNLVVFGVW